MYNNELEGIDLLELFDTDTVDTVEEVAATNDNKTNISTSSTTNSTNSTSQARKAQNAGASKRYRERKKEGLLQLQKQKADLEKQVMEHKREVASLKNERDELVRILRQHESDCNIKTEDIITKDTVKDRKDMSLIELLTTT